MWGFSNTEILTECEMVSAFSAFLPSLINSETQAVLKLGLEKKDRDGFYASLKADELPVYKLWLEIISHRW